MVRATTIDEISRTTVVSTFVDVVGLGTDSRAEGEESTSLGVFNEAIVDGLGFGDLSNATGEALQDSEIRFSADGVLWVDGAVDRGESSTPVFCRVHRSVRIHGCRSSSRSIEQVPWRWRSR